MLNVSETELIRDEREFGTPLKELLGSKDLETRFIIQLNAALIRLKLLDLKALVAELSKTMIASL